MFQEYITKEQTPFTSEVADTFFKNIDGSLLAASIGNECSFTATMRALIAPRMTEDETLVIIGDNTGTNNPSYSNADKLSVMQDFVPGFLPNMEGRLYIYNVSNSNNTANGKFDFIDHNFEELHEGWHRLVKITDFFRKTFRVMCFINPAIHSTILFVEREDFGKLHYLQCATFAFLPWFLERDKEITEDEMNLINSLRKKTSSEYIKCLNKMAEKYDFRTMSIKNLLDGFETRFETAEINRIEQKIEDLTEGILDFNRRIGELLKEKRDQETILLGYQTRVNNAGESEIMDYFLSNKNLVLESVTDTLIIFGVKTYVEYFDEDMAEKIINNKQSYIYRPNGRACNNIIPEDDMEKFMRAIFIDRVLKLRFCAIYTFALQGNVTAPSHYPYSYEFTGYMPNTHTDRYSCLGNYQRVINEYLLKNDYIGALEQCVASCSSLNLGDVPVMEEFMRQIYGISQYDTSTCCIELPNGDVVKPKEAIEWLKSQEEQENE